MKLSGKLLEGFDALASLTCRHIAPTLYLMWHLPWVPVFM